MTSSADHPLQTVLLPDGASLAVEIHGEGPPLLLLHGFPLDHSMWVGQLPLARSYQLIMPDQRGFGANSCPAGSQGPASIEQLADDAAALLEGLGVQGPVAVCGLSMGGYVAQHLAVRHPRLVGSLILVDTKLEADTPEARAGRGELAAKVSRLGQEVVARAMIPNLLAAASEDAAHQPPLQAQRRDQCVLELTRMIHACPVATITAALAALGARPDMSQAMRGVACPVLLVVGALDTITPPACLERAAGIFPHARLRIVPDCGHMTPLEAPEIFNAEVEDFLRGVAVDRAAAGVLEGDRLAGAPAVAGRVVAGQPGHPAGQAGHSDPGANPAAGER
jgi:pimeloyl-ACP methyl ester carboxylesterase